MEAPSPKIEKHLKVERPSSPEKSEEIVKEAEVYEDKFLNGFNGLTLEEIERRAKPVKENDKT